MVDCREENEMDSQFQGVHLDESHINDHQKNGKTCHQCRQRTKDFAPSCKTPKRSKICPLKYCYKCLLNRYGEKAEEVDRLGDWCCPKCRGICNCSFCMKKRGLKPTGILFPRAREIGFSSVSEMLLANPPEKLGCEKNDQDITASPKQPVSRNKDPITASPCNWGTEISFGGNDGISFGLQNSIPSDHEKNPKVKNFEDFEAIIDEKWVHMGHYDESNLDKDFYLKVHEDADEIEDVMDSENEVAVDSIPLPQGSGLTSVAGIEVAAEDVGDALQFLEFCAAFGKVLMLTKGHAEALLRELMREQRRCRVGDSLAIRFQVQLLSIMLEDMGEEIPSSSPIDIGTTWLQALHKCEARLSSVYIEILAVFFDRDGYTDDNLDVSKKLRLMNFLCDEALCTAKMRDWIDIQNSNFIETQKKAKHDATVAKDREKSLKKKLRDELENTVVTDAGAPATNIAASTLKGEIAQAHAETLTATRKATKCKQRSDAVRTEPIFSNAGHAFWKFAGLHGEDEILLQDMGSWETGVASENWYVYEAEQKEEISRYISSASIQKKLRAKYLKHSQGTKDQKDDAPPLSEFNQTM